MELNGEVLKADVRTGLESIENKKRAPSNVSCRNELEYCNRCFESEEKRKKAEERCGMLELEIERKKREFELLETKIAIVTLDKLTIEDEVFLLEKEKRELENKITVIENRNVSTAEELKGAQGDVHLTEEGDKVFDLMMEISALNVEIGLCKAKCKNLELHVAELEKRLHGKDGGCTLSEMLKVGIVSSGGGTDICELNKPDNGFHGAATPVMRPCIDGEGRGMAYASQARKQLVFEERIPTRKMAPVTPASARPPPVCPIDISDSDDEANTTKFPVLDIPARKTASIFTDSVGVLPLEGNKLPSKDNLSWSFDQSDEDDVPHCNRQASSMMGKRKRAFNMVSSDSGSDTDDNIPMSRLRTYHPHEPTVPSHHKSNSSTAAVSGNKNGKPVRRRRLMPLRKQQYSEDASEKCFNKSLENIETQYLHGIPTNGTSTSDETEEDESENEDESLGSFIVSSSDSEGEDECKDISTGDERSTDESDDASEGIDYGDIISRIGRWKDHVIKWEFEADMLAAFGRNPELCMKAVCALYRQQTSEEKLSKATIVYNQRGFSQCDATRGSLLGEFLTDGDPLGDLKKSVKELQEHDPKGVELCRTLATHYSKQLFAMYQNKEDPLWPGRGPN